VHYEFDFRDLYYSKPESALGVPMDKCSLAVVQDESFKYVISRPCRRCCSPRKDPASSSTAPPIRPTPRGSPSTRQDARLAAGFADRTLTGYRATPNGWKCARVGMTA